MDYFLLIYRCLPCNLADFDNRACHLMSVEIGLLLAGD